MNNNSQKSSLARDRSKALDSESGFHGFKSHSYYFCLSFQSFQKIVCKVRQSVFFKFFEGSFPTESFTKKSEAINQVQQHDQTSSTSGIHYTRHYE